MSHSCSSALVRCMDFRLTKDVHKWMEEKGIMNDCDMISIAGISKAIADNPDSEESKFILNQIGLSIKLHNTKTLYIMHHTDCGAAGLCCLDVLSVMELLVEGKERLKREIGDSLKIACFVHVDYHESKRTYFVSANSWREWQSVHVPDQTYYM